MLLQLLLKGLLIGFIVCTPIGPMAVLVIQRTANRNFKSGMFTGLGIAFSDSIWMGVAGFSLTYVIDFLNAHQSSLQLIGAVVVFLLGLNIFRSHPLETIRKYRGKSYNYFQSFGTAMLLAISNPVLVLAYIAILAGFNIVFSFSGISSAVFFVAGFFIGASLWWTTLSFFINLFRHKFNLRVLWWFNKISGSVIMFFVVVSVIVLIFKGNFRF